ncbi:hypothetical protein DNU06_03310 [Putridiphycobacter roseus]|uniref:Secretion system C-terminal sorting domain-containing protein n=1 Tax=Putridiphycobacter roseus TaxID=2219161 RepID=A0A2W1NT98_9FLAO|nr:T9SS type A sorting domain-containing protein [Putridiphycobacter roseus]PZE18872.1 hypothetical protein DNU06_03310 [Putridiphycobacter roseus]
MKKILLSILSCMFVLSAIGQNLSDKNWIFGRTDGSNTTNINLDFYSGSGNSLYTQPLPLSMSPAPSAISSSNGFESWAVASDPNTGQLIFYTDGNEVFDATHNNITPTTPAYGLGASPSSAQPVVTCVMPICPFNKYYVFSNPTGKDPAGTTSGPVTYRIYDNSTATPSFSPTTSLPGLYSNTAVGEGMVIIPHGNDPYTFFLVTRLLNPINNIDGLSGNSQYVVYQIDPAGVTYLNVYDFGPGIGLDNTGASPIMNMSFNGNANSNPSIDKVAFTASRRSATSGDSRDTNYVFTCEFNNTTGQFLTATDFLVDAFDGEILYDCEFSPTGDFLYYASYFNSNLYQFQFSSGLKYQVAGFGPLRAGGLKLAPDGYIYHIKDAGLIGNNGTVQIGRITNPDVALTASTTTGTPDPIYDNVNIISTANTFATNFPEFLTTPQWSAVVDVAGSDTICQGESTDLLATIDAMGIGVTSYSWYYSSDGTNYNLIPGSGASNVVNQPGQYYILVNLEGSCNITSIPITIYESEDCCAAADDPLFTTITNNVTTNTYWDGKIYIPNNTIITVNNSVLDITTADVVFGSCSGIDFINGAELRANNSVFRPCSINDTWRGLKFFGSTINAHQINENTFKNAEIAINLEGKDELNNQITAQINSNTFSNCNEGIYINQSIYHGTIYGNNFITNNSFPNYFNCYESTNPNNVINIHANSFFNAELRIVPIEISQNSMSNNSLETALIVSGIDLLNTSTNVSSNKLTNMTDAITIQSPIGLVNIENNMLELNNAYSTSSNNTSQISIFNSQSSTVRISGNKLNNGDNIKSYIRTAIFTDGSSNINIFNNAIDGFDIGIYANQSGGLNISDNYLTNISNFGINTNLNEESTNFITCNDITMRVDLGSGISVEQGNSSTQITSNCIKDSHLGIELKGNSTIPIVSNNFIYNYQIGILNNGHTGSIGTASNPGMNTLWSNRNNSTDISSPLTTLNIANNFGVFNIFGNIITTQNNPYHSTASCAFQIAGYDNQGNLNTNFACRNDAIFLEAFEEENGELKLPSLNKFLTYLEHNENKFEIINAATNIEGINKSYLEEVLNYFNLKQADLNSIWYNYYKHNESYEQALVRLNNLNDSHYKQVERLNLKILNDITLNESDLKTLEKLINESNNSNANYNLAVSIAKSTAIPSVYKYNFPISEAPIIDQSKTIQIQKDMILLSAFPNPSEDQITLEILNGSESTYQTITIYNIDGKIVHQENISFTSGRKTLNIEHFASGTYFMSLNSEGEISGKLKFIKL